MELKQFLVYFALFLAIVQHSSATVVDENVIRTNLTEQDEESGESYTDLVNKISLLETDTYGSVESIMMQMEMHWAVKEVNRYKELNGKWPVRGRKKKSSTPLPTITSSSALRGKATALRFSELGEAINSRVSSFGSLYS